ncbi:SDR family NAD(P)-dependent oxidoreductase, partial [Saccharomonospora iraqiensis]|uniref:SDR family NAD(P)-dependent oxidoreductase n=1 Tax=Saccharomonospora iraqiensis TaxID=52698 RepID=UPI00022DED94
MRGVWNGDGWVRDGDTVVVTGGSSGIGAATARVFAERGCRVVVVGRSADAVQRSARRCGGVPCVADLAGPGAVDTVLDVAGEPDVLVCNAGVGGAGPLAYAGPAEVEHLVRVNLLAPALLLRAVLPGMLRRGRGHLVLVSSIAGGMAVGGEAVYSATKAGLHALAASVRHEVAGHGIGVTVVVPGAVDTAFFDRRGTPYPRRFPRPVPAG